MHKNYMKRALELAQKGGRNVFPNPQVGAVIVNNHKIIGEGFHQAFGGPHAEVHAFNNATSNVEGSTMYVTLEPCSHYGKTPPCAQKIIDLGVKEVFIASIDPNPLVSGKGIKMLEDAGIQVHVGLEKEASDALNEHFYYYVTQKIPFVTLKMATSLDGKYATQTGDSKWITSEASRNDVHVERSKYQSILVGIQTILTDDPKLNVRLEGDQDKQPLRIVLDTHGRIPLESQVVKDDLDTLVVTASMTKEKELELLKENVQVLYCKTKGDHIDLKDMLLKLGKKGIQSLFVEGGKHVHESFLKQRLLNQIIVYLAPKILGGDTSLRNLDIDTLSQAIQFQEVTYDFINEDIKMKGKCQSCLQEL
jgi:diaminohydroxyphosphoribosylaminopyrimidine deaminase/5-amino-6-(5-phosphoribosylamino)uracil reductase